MTSSLRSSGARLFITLSRPYGSPAAWSVAASDSTRSPPKLCSRNSSWPGAGPPSAGGGPPPGRRPPPGRKEIGFPVPVDQQDHPGPADEGIRVRADEPPDHAAVAGRAEVEIARLDAHPHAPLLRGA